MDSVTITRSCKLPPLPLGTLTVDSCDPDTELTSDQRLQYWSETVDEVEGTVHVLHELGFGAERVGLGKLLARSSSLLTIHKGPTPMAPIEHWIMRQGVELQACGREALNRLDEAGLHCNASDIRYAHKMLPVWDPRETMSEIRVYRSDVPIYTGSAQQEDKRGFAVPVRPASGNGGLAHAWVYWVFVDTHVSPTTRDPEPTRRSADPGGSSHRRLRNAGPAGSGISRRGPR